MNFYHSYIIAILFSVSASLSFAQEEEIAAKIYSNWHKAVVQIFSLHDDNSFHGQGSGVVIKSKQWIITNYHVLGDAATLQVKHNGTRITLDSLVYVDIEQDILIMSYKISDTLLERLKIPDVEILPFKDIVIGQNIFAIGSPFGFENTITDGVVSGVRLTKNKRRTFVQVSAPFSSGSSGGALFTAQGKLLGISTLVIAGMTAQNLNFAIPAEHIFQAVENAKKEPDLSALSNEEKGSYYYTKAHSLYAAKNFTESKSYFLKASGLLHPDKIYNAYYYAGKAYERLGKKDSAMHYYERSLDHDPSVEAYCAIGALFTSSREYHKAIEFYKQALALDSYSIDALLGYGWCAYALEDYSSSLLAFSTVLQLDPENQKAALTLGKIALLNKQYKEARQVFESVLEVNPDSSEALLGLAEVYGAEGNEPKKKELIEKAQKLAPKIESR